MLLVEYTKPAVFLALERESEASSWPPWRAVTCADAAVAATTAANSVMIILINKYLGISSSVFLRNFSKS